MKFDRYMMLFPTMLLAAILCGVFVFFALVPHTDADRYTHTTIDGVDCIVYHVPHRGGISCNWERYNEQHP